ncbi:MAG: Gmad2 immunoglobulin-like domain-containing protein [Dehalococcoidia bacterium]|nr:Gmad2 immunoglobulin-like domain-containing protein [Dehalococcoidia bacterium]
MKTRRACAGILVIICASIIIGCFQTGKPAVRVGSFEECTAASYAVLESYPRQCRTPDGTLFVEDIGNTIEKLDRIRLAAPRPNDVIISPLVIKGEARGTWFFEATFPVKLLSENGDVLVGTAARAKGEWMTMDFVSFEAELKFSKPSSSLGTLVLQKDNPSGLAERDEELRIPVLFEKQSR